jgi:hypothetical protein
MMSVLFNVLLHVLLIGTLVVLVITIMTVTLAQTQPVERAIRGFALIAGALVTLGAHSAGLSFADFVIKAMAGSHAGSVGAKVAVTLFPGILGVFFGWYLIRALKKSENIAIRVFAFVGMLAATAFFDVYATATNETGAFLGATALPNVSFVTGIILYIILTYDPEASAQPVTLFDKAQALRRPRNDASQGGETTSSKTG